MKRGAEIKQEILSGVSGYEDLVRGLVWWTQTVTDESAVRLRCGRDSHIRCPSERADCQVFYSSERDSGGCDFFFSVCLSVLVCGSWCTLSTGQGSVLTEAVITPLVHPGCGGKRIDHQYQSMWRTDEVECVGGRGFSGPVGGCLTVIQLFELFLHHLQVCVCRDELWRRLMLCCHVSAVIWEVTFMLVQWVWVMCSVFVAVAVNVLTSAAWHDVSVNVNADWIHVPFVLNAPLVFTSPAREFWTGMGHG